MSDRAISRRTETVIAFDGIDISNSIRPYFISLNYTDSEDDEADDLEIRIHDREHLWREKWLNDAVIAAASDYSGSSVLSATTCSVTANSGLNVRSGPDTSSKKIGILAYGDSVRVISINNGWAEIVYQDSTAFVSANYLKSAAENSLETSTGLFISAAIIRRNWNGDGKDDILDCGAFELDSISADGPPDTITIRATALPFAASIRQSAKCRGWESYYLSGIVKEMANKNNLNSMFLSDYDPFYERAEQYQESDISFLRRKCRDAGLSLKISNRILIIFQQSAYESKPEIFTIRPGCGYISHSLKIGTADTQYQSCRVSYNDPLTGKSISGIAKIPDYNKDSKNNQQLEITAKVTSIKDAETLAKQRLRLHNKYQKTADFTFPGNPDFIAGATVLLDGYGAWDGKYIISRVAHSISSNGYVSAVSLRRSLENW